MTVELQPEFPHRTRRKDKLSPSAAKSSTVPYVELHAHSSYSFLDGASLPEELAARAAELGYDALALTDHDGVYGSLEFAHMAKHLGVRPITGAELTLDIGVGSTEPTMSGGAGFAGAGAAMSETTELTFEQAQTELERIVERLEQGQASLDEALALWERGEKLYAFCREKLDGAQGKVVELARRVEQARPEPPA